MKKTGSSPFITQRSSLRSAVVLLSGGMDSAALLRYVKKHFGVPDVCALSFIYGQKHSREIKAAEWQAKAAGVREHRVIDISFFGNSIAGGSALTDRAVAIPDLGQIPKRQRKQPPTYVPNRNMVFLSIAAAYAEARGCEHVFYGAQAQDEYGYWDCTVDFVGRINHVLRLNRGKAITIHAPFTGKSKAEVLKIGLALGVDYSHTWSCYRGKQNACGKCPSCVERIKAFRRVGVVDPVAVGRRRKT